MIRHVEKQNLRGADQQDVFDVRRRLRQAAFEPHRKHVAERAEPAQHRGDNGPHQRAVALGQCSDVAALQCDFEPTLLTTSNYNAMLAQHRAELASAFKTVNDYFLRIGGPKIGQKQFDQYGTRTYSAFSTVQAQHNFCQTAGSVGRDAIFAPRGTLYRVAQNRMGALRKALVVQRDQAYGTPSYGFVASVPSFEKKCWKRDTLTKKCAQAWLQSQGK